MGYRSLARNHDFTVLWIGQTISGLGSAISSFAFPLVGYALTSSALITSIVGTAHLVGMLVVMLPAGALADRVDRRLVMRVSAGAGAVLYATVVAAGIAGWLTVPHLIAVALLTGATEGLFRPAETGAVRTVVSTEELPTALSQNQARQHIASLLGAPVGGLLLAVTRWMPFAADAVSYAISWLLLGRIRTNLTPRPDGAPRPRQSALADVISGWRFQFGHPMLRVLAIWAPLTNLVVNAVFFAANLRLISAGFPPWQIGLIETSVGVIGILGALCAPWLIQRIPTGLLVIMSAWAFVPILLPMALWNTPWIVAAALAIGIFLNPAGNAAISSYAQTQMRQDQLGRFSATMGFTSMSLMPLAPILAGGLLSVLTGTVAMLILALPCGLVALIPTIARAVRTVPRPAEWESPQPATDGAHA
ncbi:MFS transporter [Microlunatus elymi]|uniref:MFS transporter n=1 Tax=Microlunatus elymi TaxID=2596828 RepID=A0A516Q596_9ACTN|nr:MFS transporter [Microlunatus elymi]